MAQISFGIPHSAINYKKNRINYGFNTVWRVALYFPFLLNAIYRPIMIHISIYVILYVFLYWLLCVNGFFFIVLQYRTSKRTMILTKSKLSWCDWIPLSSDVCFLHTTKMSLNLVYTYRQNGTENKNNLQFLCYFLHITAQPMWNTHT